MAIFYTHKQRIYIFSTKIYYIWRDNFWYLSTLFTELSTEKVHNFRFLSSYTQLKQNYAQEDVIILKLSTRYTHIVDNFNNFHKFFHNTKYCPFTVKKINSS